MHLREYINKVVENKKAEDMEKLGDMMAEVMYKLKEYDYDCYEKYKMELYTMAYGKVLSNEMAQDIVTEMKPYHLHWTKEQTTEVMKANGLNFNENDFFVVMNMAYNDYHDLLGEELENYVRFSKMFIEDVDAKPDKVFRYFME